MVCGWLEECQKIQRWESISTVVSFVPTVFGCFLEIPSLYVFSSLRLLYVPVSVCCVCVRPQLSHVLSYVIPLLCHYSHERSGSYWKFTG